MATSSGGHVHLFTAEININTGSLEGVLLVRHVEKPEMFVTILASTLLKAIV